MNSNDTRGRRNGRGGRRPSNRKPRRDDRRDDRHDGDERFPREYPVKKLSFWQRIVAFFTGGPKKPAAPARPEKRAPRPAEARATEPRSNEARGADARGTDARNSRRPGPPERVEVTTPKLYVGNLSYDATESDLLELFNGVGKVQNTEIVTQKGTYRSKGFGFVTMLTVDEAKRAVQELHDKDFMGRKLVVNGSKSEGPRDL